MSRLRFLISSVFILTIPLSTQAQEDLARGTVFLDTNQNDLRDPSEPGIADIKVSNGERVVKTDARRTIRNSTTNGTAPYSLPNLPATIYP